MRTGLGFGAWGLASGVWGWGLGAWGLDRGACGPGGLGVWAWGLGARAQRPMGLGLGARRPGGLGPGHRYHRQIAKARKSVFECWPELPISMFFFFAVARRLRRATPYPCRGARQSPNVCVRIAAPAIDFNGSSSLCFFFC